MLMKVEGNKVHRKIMNCDTGEITEECAEFKTVEEAKKFAKNAELNMEPGVFYIHYED